MDDILDKIKNLGLNSYEAKVYLALFERESLSVSEISQISHVPKSRIYDTLDSLMIEGLAVLKPGRHKRYSAASPSLFKEKFINRIEENYTEQKKIVEKTAITLQKNYESRLENGFENLPLDYFKILKDPLQVHRAFMRLTSEAQNEILACSKPPYSVPEKGQGEQFQQQDNTVKARNIKVRNIEEIPKDIDEIKWRIQDFETSGPNCEDRVIAELPMKLVIFDEINVMLPLQDPIASGNSFTTQVITHPALAKLLKISFETLWEQAEDYHILKDLIK